MMSTATPTPNHPLLQVLGRAQAMRVFRHDDHHVYIAARSQLPTNRRAEQDDAQRVDCLDDARDHFRDLLLADFTKRGGHAAIIGG